MAFSDADSEKYRKRTKNKNIAVTTNERWSDKQKLEAATHWLVLGNLALTARLTGIPEVTLRIWKQTAWWKELIEDLRSQERIQVSNKLKQIVNAAQTVVAARLEQGDPVVLKDGTIVMKPVAMRDAHRVAVDSLNQQQTLEKAADFGVSHIEGNDEKLVKLAERFAEFVTKKVDEKRTIDVEDIAYAMDDKRETGLQERVCEVPGETRSNQEEVRTNDSKAAS